MKPWENDRRLLRSDAMMLRILTEQPRRLFDVASKDGTRDKRWKWGWRTAARSVRRLRAFGYIEKRGGAYQVIVDA